MESATAAVRSASLARARPAPLVHGRARGAGRVVGAGLAARARRRALVAVASHQEHHEPLPPRAQEGGAVAVATQADEAEVHAIDAPAAAAETSSSQLAAGKTVRVRFVLKRQCTFGQSVCLVGDDPALGLWDLSNAFPLKWAESHDWTLEKDLPANKLIEFKFLLQDSTGKLHWQGGPNRSFQTGETAANTLVVFEDWGDVKNQKIVEEGGVASAGIEQTVVSNDSESRKGTVLEAELQVDDNLVQEDEFVVAKEDKKPAVATDASVQVDWVKTDEANPQKSKLHEEMEVLDELLGKENMENSGISSTDENYAEKTGDDILFEDGVLIENGLATAYEHDLLWGWKALQQLLMSLGFKMDTT
ncbi:uncharacterized LOC100279613 [Zea mays]|uniref:Carbohydrate-binding-like fold n=1 Tax=Zea mays TaxID=4577 RepID=B7ZZ23_MAIZE|nr:uncharacterized LOC100279613 [Zea mays]ACL53172.1 unknown [Zea mays]ACN33970.1 unknown [Zea mays]AQK86313.1 Carbohydrate-binding-like fold [Zea mays]|eukprot:NP_001146081.1 uncharacterized protein LOC100279613 [Zea mays]